MRKYLQTKYIALCALMVVACSALLGPSLAAATETESETKVKEVATQVGDEGVVIVLAILAALVALIVVVTIVPKAVKMIKRFI